MPVKSGAVRVSVDVRSRVFQTVLAASLLLLVLLLVALVAIRNQADARGWVKHTYDVRLANAGF